VSETKDETKKCAQEAYEVSLGKHHNFIVRKTTSAMMGTAPGRADLIANLGPRCLPHTNIVTIWHIRLSDANSHSLSTSCCRLAV
jgi:hypothetical protein